MGLAGQLAVQPAGLLAGAHPLRGPHGLVGEHRDGLREQAVGVHPAVQQLLDAVDRLHPGPCLLRLAQVLGVTGARGPGLGRLRLQLLQPRVQRPEPLLVQPGEVLDLHPEGLHRDLVLDERLFGGPYGPLQTLLGPRRSALGRRPVRSGDATLFSFRSRHPTSLAPRGPGPRPPPRFRPGPNGRFRPVHPLGPPPGRPDRTAAPTAPTARTAHTAPERGPLPPPPQRRAGGHDDISSGATGAITVIGGLHRSATARRAHRTRSVSRLRPEPRPAPGVPLGSWQADDAGTSTSRPRHPAGAHHPAVLPRCAAQRHRRPLRPGPADGRPRSRQRQGSHLRLRPGRQRHTGTRGTRRPGHPAHRTAERHLGPRTSPPRGAASDRRPHRTQRAPAREIPHVPGPAVHPSGRVVRCLTPPGRPTENGPPP